MKMLTRHPQKKKKKRKRAEALGKKIQQPSPLSCFSLSPSVMVRCSEHRVFLESVGPQISFNKRTATAVTVRIVNVT